MCPPGLQTRSLCYVAVTSTGLLQTIRKQALTNLLLETYWCLHAIILDKKSQDSYIGLNSLPVWLP